MGKLSRDKGARFEREIAAIFRALWPGLPIRRGSQAAGAVDGDVVIPDIGLRIECKVGAHPNPAAALDQCIGDSAADDELHIAITRQDGCKPMVSLPLSQFITLIKLMFAGDTERAGEEIGKRWGKMSAHTLRKSRGGK